MEAQCVNRQKSEPSVAGTDWTECWSTEPKGSTVSVVLHQVVFWRWLTREGVALDKGLGLEIQLSSFKEVL